MRVVWDQGRVTVRDVYEALRLRRRTAYTTIMTTFRSLVRKGLVSQDRSSNAYGYVAIVTDAEVATAILDVVVDELMGGQVQPLIEHLERRAGPNG